MQTLIGTVLSSHFNNWHGKWMCCGDQKKFSEILVLYPIGRPEQSTTSSHFLEWIDILYVRAAREINWDYNPTLNAGRFVNPIYSKRHLALDGIHYMLSGCTRQADLWLRHFWEFIFLSVLDEKCKINKKSRTRTPHLGGVFLGVGYFLTIFHQNHTFRLGQNRLNKALQASYFSKKTKHPCFTYQVVLDTITERTVHVFGWLPIVIPDYSFWQLSGVGCTAIRRVQCPCRWGSTLRVVSHCQTEQLSFIITFRDCTKIQPPVKKYSGESDCTTSELSSDFGKLSLSILG